MDNKTLKKAKSMALEAGYQDVKLLRPWRTCEVIEPIFTDGNCHFIGEPMYMLAKQSNIRWTKAQIAKAILLHQITDVNASISRC